MAKLKRGPGLQTCDPARTPFTLGAGLLLRDQVTNDLKRDHNASVSKVTMVSTVTPLSGAVWAAPLPEAGFGPQAVNRPRRFRVP